MSKVQRTYHHLLTRAAREVGGWKRIHQADRQLLKAAAQELTGDRMPKRRRSAAQPRPRCPAYDVRGTHVVQCRRAPGESGYCTDHEPKRGSDDQAIERT